MIEEIIFKAIEYNKGDPKRIQHFLKVHSFCRTLGVLEKLDEDLLFTLEIAAVLHDIGIHNSEKKYASSAGIYQQMEGPAVARDILLNFGLSNDRLARICYLIAHHHTYTNVDGLDYQILIEADFLVNIFEDAMDEKQIESICTKIFKTSSGTALLEAMFLNQYKIPPQA